MMRALIISITTLSVVHSYLSSYLYCYNFFYRIIRFPVLTIGGSGGFAGGGGGAADVA